MANTAHPDSLSELERQAESTRAELAQTVDALHHRVSPSALKEDMRGYVRDQSQHMLGRVESFARDNPLQAAALAAGIAYPLWQMARKMPAPLLLVGAGLALSRRTAAPQDTIRRPFQGGTFGASRQDGPSTMDAMKDKATEMVTDVAETIRDTSNDMASRLTDNVSSVKDSVRDTIADTTAAVKERVSGAYQSGTETIHRTTAQARTMVNQASGTAVDTMDRQPLLIGAVAFALGSLLASALPVTRQENRLMGQAASELKRRGAGLGADALNRAKDVSSDLYRTASEEVRDHGLTPEAARNTIRVAADRVSAEAEELGMAPTTGTSSNMENGNG